MFCQETWLEELDQNIINLISNDFIFFSRKNKKKKKKGRVEGTNGWFVKNKFKNIVKLKYVNNRISFLILSLKKSRYIVVGCYLSCDEKAFDELMLVDKIVTEEVKLGNFKIIILGDFNADIGRGNVRDRKFRAWVGRNGLNCLNLLFTQKISQTFLNLQGHFSAIDYIFTHGGGDWSEILRCNIVTSMSEIMDYNTLTCERALSSYESYRLTVDWADLCRNTWDLSNLSDHRAVALIMNTEKIEEYVRPKIFRRINWLNKTHVDLYSKMVHKNLRASGIMEQLKEVEDTNDTEVRTTAFERIIRQFHSCLIDSKRETNINLGTIKHYTKRNEWWSEEMERAKKYRNICFIIFRIFRTDEYRQRFSQARKNFKIQMKIEKKKVENAKAARLNMHFRLIYWKTVKKLRSNKVKPSVDLEKLTAHFSKLLVEENINSANANYDKECSTTVMREYNRLKNLRGNHIVDEEEICNILKSLRNNKAVGHLGVSNEMIKYARSEFVPKILTQIMNVAINTNTMPECFNVGLLTPIIKDEFGDTSCLNNIRPITISDTIANVFELYIKKRLQQVEVDTNQMGFRKKASTSHAIFTFREGQRHLKETVGKGYGIFFDFSKAFDKINRTKMMHKLYGKIDEFIWRTIYIYYEISVVYIVGEDGEKSVKIRVKVGVKQGGPASPVLFIIYANDLIVLLKNSGRVLSINNIVMGVLGYADDTECQCESAADVWKCIEIVEEYCTKEDIILNGSKTAWMKLGERPLVHPVSKKKVPRQADPDENFMAGGTLVEKVYTFKYLGYMVTSDDNNATHIEKRKLVANLARKELDKMNLKNMVLEAEVKGLMIQTLVRSKLIFGMENASLAPSTIEKLATFEANIIKEYMGVASRSYTTPLLLAANIKNFGRALKIRKFSMLLQLITNDLTCALITQCEETNYSTIITESGYHSLASDNENQRRNKIASCCIDSINFLKNEHKNQEKDIMSQATEYLLKHPSHHNIRMLRYLLHSKNKMRDVT